MDVRLPNGKVIKGVPDGTPKEVVMQKAIAAGLATEEDFGITSAAPQTQKPPSQAMPDGSVFDQVAAPVEAVARGLGGSISSGWQGIAELIKSRDLDSAVQKIKEVQADWQMQAPDTRQGQRGMQVLQNAMNDIESLYNAAAGGAAGLANLALRPSQGIGGAQRDVQAIKEQGLGRALGQETLNITGSPLLATGAELAPSIAETAAGFGASRAARGAPEQVARTAEDALVSTAESKSVPLLTTDVFPPDSFIGRWTQRISEKLGPLGTGTSRQTQQIARQDVVSNLADEFGVSMDAPFFEQIVKDISAKNAKALENGMVMRRKSIDALRGYGEVPTDNVEKALATIGRRQEKLKDAARQEVGEIAQKYANASSGQNFEDLAAVRSELIREIKDLEGSQAESKTSKLRAMQAIKNAIDDDMKSFASTNDRTAAADWIRSTRNLAEQLSNVKTTELKRIIEKGDIKPEIVGTVLRGGNRSELKRLMSALTPDGREMAKSAVIRDALDRSGFFRGEPNPNRFATELSRTKTQQAVDILFGEKGKAEIRGIERLLDATRRAQDAPVTVETGAQLIPFAASGALGAGLTTSPTATLATTAALSAIAKGYESRAFRNLLLKLNRTKKGSTQEKKILDKLILSATVGSQAAKTGREETQETGQ